MPEMDETCEVVITAPDSSWLAAFTRSLVDERLAACGHIVTPIRSIYRWQGQIHDEQEARVALHTRTALVPDIIERTQAAHPYDVPCVIALPIAAGCADYRAWIISETREPAGAGDEPG